jgi:hypothetical protein
MSVVDTNRRTIAAQRVGRVLGGQDRFEKEALEGDPAGALASTRRERLAGGAQGPKDGPGSFAERLRQKADAAKPKR